MKLKGKMKKITTCLLSLLMTFSTIQLTGIKDVNAASLYPESTASVKVVAENINIKELGEGDLYDIKLGGKDAFCMDHGKHCRTGNKYAKTGAKTSAKINQVINWYNDQKSKNGYGRDFVYGMAQATIWAINQGKTDDDSLASIYEDILIYYASGGASGHGLAFVSIYYKGTGTGNAILEYPTSGSFNVWSYGASSHQRLVTTGMPNSTIPVILYDEVTSTKSYSSSESIKVQVNKNDLDTSNKLSGVIFDFYKDDVKGGSAVTNEQGLAEYTFKTEFTKEATVTKEYCSNYDELTIPNRQDYVTGYTSKASAQAAADKEALAKAKKLAEEGSNQEHTYKVVETGTKDGYWLNPATNTYEKKHTGAGTVTFDIGNKRQLGSITITKRDSETNNLVDNAVYGLYARNPIIHPDGKTGQVYGKDQLVATFPGTATNGTATLNNLYLGQYYVKEITAPHGYLHSNEVYNVDLNYAGQNVQITDASATVKDKVQRASINSIKKDKEMNNGSKDPNIFDGNKDGAQGDATRKNATYGLYARENIVHSDGSTGVVTYNQVSGSIHELKATKGTDLSVKNTKANAGALLATIKTDSNGEFGFSNLYNGKYFIKEIESSEGYLVDPTEYNVDLSYTNQNETVVTKNQTVLEQVKKQAFDLVKVGHVPGTSTNAKPLANVEFTVWLESDIQRLMNTGLTLAEAKAKAPVYDKLTTNAEGKASSIELPYGYYRVAETKSAIDYATADDFFVTVTEDSRTHQSFTNNIIIDEQFSALIKAVKLDKETGKQVSLPDTTFKIKAKTDVIVDGKKFKAGEYIGYWNWNIMDGFYTDSWKTNEDGYVIINEKLGAGTYELEEVNAPYGYVLDETPIEFKITNENMYDFADDGKTPLIKSYKEDISVKGQISVEKRGEVLVGFNDKTHKFFYEERGLVNAKYNVVAKEDIIDPSNDGAVLYKKGTVVETLVTGKDGKATTKKLPLGKYEIVEVEAPHGMVINGERKTVELTYKDQYTPIVFGSTSFVNERQRVEAKVVKVDSQESTIGLSGGEFNFIAKEDIKNADNQVIVKAGTIINSYTSTDDGSVILSDLDLPLDHNFQLIETKAPIGYVLDETPVELNTDYQGQDVQKVVIEKTKENERTHVDISKIDLTTGKELPGNHMTVFEKENQGSIFETWISGDKPHLIENLSTDVIYVLRETSSVKGFYIASDIEFTIDQKGNVYVFDEDGNKVLAKDNLIVMENDLVKGRLEWNKQGEIFNQTVTGQTEFGKTESPVWEKSNLLQAEVTIYAAEDIILGNGKTYYHKDEKIQVLESDWDAVQSEDLLVGRYYYVESKTPHGYVIDTDKHYFEVKDNQSSELQIITSTLDNKRPTVNIEFTKFMETFKHHNKVDDAYKDVVFGIYARENTYDYMGNVGIKNGTLIDTTGIDELGQLINVPDLPNGVYYIKELATNKDYVLDTNEYNFEVGYHGQDVSSYTIKIGEDGKVENKLIRGDIEIKKNDSFDEAKKLADVEFNISADKDMKDVISTVKTDENGIASFKNMEIGKYYIQEAKQVSGYVLNDHIYEVEVTSNGEILTIDVDNKPTEMYFSKVDETGTKELPGAEVQVIDKETSEIVDKWTSTEENHIINYLVEGKEYIFKEISAPYGYEVAEEILFVAGDGKTVTMKDELILTDIQVNKVDSQTMKPIKSLDFEFTMYSDEECTKAIKTVHANKEDGTATFKDVPYSTVYIKETKAPVGYKLSEEVKKVVIDENLQGVGDIHSFVYLNTLMPVVVIKTSDEAPISALIGLTALTGLSAIFLSRKRKKDEEKQ